MKWSHRATKKRWFRSEWQASIDALDDAFALGFADDHRPVPIAHGPAPSCPSTLWQNSEEKTALDFAALHRPALDVPEHARTSKRRSCSFADDLELYISLEDSL